jgi:hypothetical protein
MKPLPPKPPLEPGTAAEAYNAERRRLLRRAFALVDTIGLTDDERRELAMMVGTHGASGPVSWAALSIADLEQLIERLVGYEQVSVLLAMRIIRQPAAEAPARHVG